MKVLIIDDESAMHLILRRMLGKIGEVDIVGSFQETASAYSYLEKHPVDLIFIDINMPRESGLEFARRLRDSGRQMRLVFITSHTEYALPAFDVYAYDYMVKPVVQERLHQTVRRAMAEGLVVKEPVERELPENRIAFHCLGSMEIRSVQGEIVKWKTSKSTELFGYLLIHKGRLVSRSRLIEDIFGGMPLKNAEIYLNTTVYQLRKLFEANGLKGSIHSDGDHYALVLSKVQADLLSFEEGCKQLAVIEDADMERALELEQLYAGDLFGDRAYPWAWGEVERLSSMYNSFTQRLCKALLDRADTTTAIRLLMKLIAHNELDETTIKLLMTALARQKNNEALTRQYLQFRELLHAEMGIGPSLEVTALYHELLSSLEFSG